MASLLTRSRIAGAAVLAASAALLLGGCGTTATHAPATPAGSSPAANPTSTARQQVLAAYQGMVNAEVQAFATNSLAGSDIETYTWQNALVDAKNVIFQDLQNNIVFTGRPTYTVKGVNVDLTPTPHTATVTVCWDESRWTPVDKTTRKSMTAPGEPTRYLSTSTLRTVGSRWVVVDGTADRSKRC